MQWKRRLITRSLCAMVSAIFLTHTPSRGESVFTAEKLYALCNGGHGSVDEAFCVAFLFGVKAGLAQATAMFKAGYGCIPPTTPVVQLRSLVQKYIAAHPEDQNEDGRSVAIAAIGSAFPCSRQFDQATGNATDVCAKRCLPPGGLHEPPGVVVTGLPPSTEACMRACGEEIGRGR
jgi:Rap1a immunity proteins